MIVGRQDFERALARVRAETRDPAAGLYGPGTMTWRISRESVVFLGAARAALLQLAHPYVAHAIDQHSETKRDPVGRFNRTFSNVYGMVFGDLEAALGAARRVRGVHDHIGGPIGEDVGRFARGHRYHAHDAGALVWVWTTLIETAVMTYEIGFGALTADEREAYYRESVRFAWLFGVPEEAVPPTFAEFQAYSARMVQSDELAVGAPAREMGRFLLSGPSRTLRPFMRWYTTLTAGLLPARIREGYGLPFSRADEVVYDASLRAIRRGWPLIPPRLRRRPEYFEALRRLEGRPAPDRVGRALEQMLLRTVRPRGA
jgi:uncharacterized protein (DUF2236 family)